jgi:hypothetical protein
MTRVEVFDPPICCPTGVCGPEVDPVLPRVAGDLAWLGRCGVHVARFNLAHEPGAFAGNPVVLRAMKDGDGALPLVLVDERLVCRGRYPSREELAAWAGFDRASSPEGPLLPSLSPIPSGDSGTGSDRNG